MLTHTRLLALLAVLPHARVGVVGDACLDVYWEADMTRSRLARENPHFILPVMTERLSPGGGSNAAACVAALGAATAMLGVVGADWRGRELRRLIAEAGIDTAHLLTAEDRLTTAYCKPLRKGLSDVVYEDPHLYFENQTPTPPVLEALLLEHLEALLPTVDALLVADYQYYGIVTPAVCARLCRAAAEGVPVVVDSRDRIGDYRGVILKPNEVEAWAMLGRAGSPHEATDADLAEAAQQLAARRGGPVCLTLGGKGCLWVEGDTATAVPAQPAVPPIDTVGAGDCFGAALTTALATGANGIEAAALANLAAGVVVKKIGTTGTATRAEMLQKYEEDHA